MNQLLGEYPCKVDAKGRVRLPSALLKQLQAFGADEFVVNRGFEKHLVLYPKTVWLEMTDKINKLNEFVAKNRKFKLLFSRGATPLSLGGSDRINLPNHLLESVGIDKEVYLVGNLNKVQIWSKAEYDAIFEEDIDMSELAEDVLGDPEIGIPAAS